MEEYHFRLALDELLTNAIRHGVVESEGASMESSENGREAAGEITLTVRYSKRGVTIGVTVCNEETA